MSYNLRKNSGLEATKNGPGSLSIRDSFEEVLWLSAGRPLPALSGPPGGSLADAFERHRARSARVRGTPPSHAFAQQRLDAGGLPIVFATLFGGKEDFLYVLDSLDRKSETLAFLRKADPRSPQLQRAVAVDRLGPAD